MPEPESAQLTTGQSLDLHFQAVDDRLPEEISFSVMGGCSAADIRTPWPLDDSFMETMLRGGFLMKDINPSQFENSFVAMMLQEAGPTVKINTLFPSLDISCQGALSEEDPFILPTGDLSSSETLHESLDPIEHFPWGHQMGTPDDSDLSIEQFILTGDLPILPTGDLSSSETLHELLDPIERFPWGYQMGTPDDSNVSTEQFILTGDHPGPILDFMEFEVRESR
ncbi:hypothetical protein CVT26_010434 [Gymnopilus dilepis]|uniref:Uncharacterized protein n=1 Tax=Gymnopilus dilepis TaxID=231916 RepID=A0A409Y0G2_9AGAR|nr:hypothetical protein CVT26_010434 [Gymnopilus dilepis]